VSDWLNILLRTIFVDNLALNYLLGMCTYLAVSQRVRTAAGLGLAVVVVLTISVPLNHLVYRYLLANGALEWAGLGALDLSFLRFIVFIGVIACFVQVLELILDRYFPRLYQALGIYLPLLTVNCAILGGSLFMVQRQHDFVESIAFGLGGGVGWALAIMLFAGIRERLRYCDAPAGLSGTGLAFVVTGILSLGFAGLRGVAF
jgi:Na+-transporting NADH:ubiquinone oxidoreductase subunit E